MSYLDKDAFAALSVMPEADIDALEASHPGWIDGQLDYWSRMIDAQLRKRYAVPFEEPYPVVVTGWLTRIVTLRCYIKRGVDPNDLQFIEVKEDADTAKLEVREAASSDPTSEQNLFDLPLRADTTASGISKGGPFGYSEQSPYVWTDKQADVGRGEDGTGGGSFG